MDRIILFEKESHTSKQMAQTIRDSLSHVKIKPVLSCDDCLTEMQASTPDILMIGTNLPDCNSLDMIARIRRMYPGIIIVLVTDYDIDEYRKDAILKGANHIISRELWTGAEILALINTILCSKTNRLCAKTNEAASGTEDLPFE